MTNKRLLDEFAEEVARHNRIVFFGGAGVSTESGIPDFRSAYGLYNGNYKVSPETILSDRFFYEHTDLFYDFYRDKMIYPSAKPNVTHKVLAALESMGKLAAVVTQNIDGLHEAAGSKQVYNLHGSVYRNHCLKCGKRYGLDVITGSTGVPECSCGGVIKPDVVLYGEALPEETVLGAIEQIAAADMLIVGGTSLTVYPAAGYVRYFGGDVLALVNKSATDYDSVANIVLHCGLGEAFSAVADYLKLDLSDSEE